MKEKKAISGRKAYYRRRVQTKPRKGRRVATIKTEGGGRGKEIEMRLNTNRRGKRFWAREFDNQ